MSKQTPILGNTCTACGTARRINNLRFDPETFSAYCENPYICSKDHPNSSSNIYERAKAGEVAEKPLASLAEVEDLYHAELLEGNPSQEVIETVKRVMNHPISVRVGVPDLVKFLINTQIEKGIASISETIRHCLQSYKEICDAEHAGKIEEVEELRKAETVEELEDLPEPSAKEDEDGDLTF